MHQNLFRYFLSRFHAEESFEPIWKKENSKARKLAPGENRIQDHPSSTARMFQPTSCCEALWRAGSKFTSNYNYTYYYIYSSKYTKLTTSYLRFVSDKNFILWKLSQWPNLCEEYQKNKLHEQAFMRRTQLNPFFYFFKMPRNPLLNAESCILWASSV